MVKQPTNGSAIPILVSGGARSGKSFFAENLALELAAQKTQASIAYIATAQVTDPEFQERIAHHQARRSALFNTVEEPLALKTALDQALSNHSVILVECIATWLGNLQYHFSTDKIATRLKEVETYLTLMAADPQKEPSIATLLSGKATHLTDLSHIATQPKPIIIFVTNETGLGIVPATKEARFYRDLLGRLNQHLASVSRAFFCCFSGLPVRLK